MDITIEYEVEPTSSDVTTSGREIVHYKMFVFLLNALFILDLSSGHDACGTFTQVLDTSVIQGHLEKYILSVMLEVDRYRANDKLLHK